MRRGRGPLREPWARRSEATSSSTARRNSLSIRSESRLLGLERPAAEIAGLVQRGQKREADPGQARGVADGLPQRIRTRIGGAARAAVQVVEFRDRRVAAFQHLDEQLSREGLQIVGLDAIRQGVHRAAPGPETVARRQSVFGVSRHGALECMTVRIGHTGHHDAVDLLHVRREYVRRERALIGRPDAHIGDEALVGHTDGDVSGPALRQEGGLQVIVAHLDYTCIGNCSCRIILAAAGSGR